jgi:uncharacterized protein YqgV (UPF0045/DUF77 family)
MDTLTEIQMLYGRLMHVYASSIGVLARDSPSMSDEDLDRTCQAFSTDIETLMKKTLEAIDKLEELDESDTTNRAERWEQNRDKKVAIRNDLLKQRQTLEQIINQDMNKWQSRMLDWRDVQMQ